MSKKALEDQNYELIKAHVIDPDNSPLSFEQQVLMDRWVVASKILDKNPIQKNAVALLRAKYPDLSRAQAYIDVKNAMRLFNSIQTFDYDFWHQWLLNDIAEHILACKAVGDRKNWAIAHKNLINAIGERQETEMDPRLIEQQKIVVPIQINNNTYNVDFAQLLGMPIEKRKAVTDTLFTEISEDDAKNLKDS